MLKLHRFWLAAGWLLIGLVVFLSLIPHPPELLAFENSDKFEHVFAYAMLSFWLCQIYRCAKSRVVVIAALTALGVGLEYVQGWTGYRTFEVLDMLCDGAGVLSGWLLACTPLGRLLAYIENYAASR